MSSKMTFSLKGGGNKKKTTTSKASSSSAGFDDDDDEDDQGNASPIINPDIPREPLVIPVQQNTLLSLREKEKAKEEEKEKANDDEAAVVQPTTTISADDQAAIAALQAEAGGGNNEDTTKTTTSKLVIEKTANTFQHHENGDNQNQNNSNNNINNNNNNPVDQDQQSKEQFQKELEDLAPELSVDSKTYRQVPIADFGAAMLRGMGWRGEDGTKGNNNDEIMSMPRPSRLGLGATPKLALEAPTHSRRRPRRQDQVQKEKRQLEQQREYEEKRQKMIKLDKQQTIQVGSIVRINSGDDDDGYRAVIRQWQGVPGLNMILVQVEGEDDAIKVKRGSVQLIDRSELMEKPFREPKVRASAETTKYVGQEKEQQQQQQQQQRSQDRNRRSDDDEDDRRRRRRRDEEDNGRKSAGSSRRNRDDDDYDRRDRRRDDDDYDRRDRRRDDDGKKRRRERDDDTRKRRRRDEEDERRPIKTWLIPNIRVRIISSKYGKSNYKEKGVVIDVSAKGTATVNVGREVLHVPERHLETALPKVGGNACILTGKHRMAKGRLLERDSRANKGAIQVFEDMNIVTTSLDDMAEWCGPLDDDLME